MAAIANLPDPGKLITAARFGQCPTCSKPIRPGQRIYHSSVLGARHQNCVESAEDDPPEAPAAPAGDATRRDVRRDAPRLWPEGDDAARDATRRDEPPRDAAVAPAADRRDDAYAAPRRDDTQFAQAGVRDAIRAELRAIVRLQIDFLERLEKLLG